MDGSNAGNMMASEVHSTGSKLESTAPMLLFTTTFSNLYAFHQTTFNSFAVSSDGKRFLIPENPMANPQSQSSSTGPPA